MFTEYFEEVKSAIDNSEEKISEYGKKKEALALDVKEKINTESESITESSELKNYSPIKHHNEMTALIHAYEKMKKDESIELNEIKDALHKKLIKIMNLPEPNASEPVVKEMYKIIGLPCQSNRRLLPEQGNHHLCRVWFTLVEIKKWKCVPGDPIRIEWVNTKHGLQRNNDLTDNITAQIERTGSGVEGLHIPCFDMSGRVANTNEFYSIGTWGQTSTQRTWWEEWVAANRPL